MATQVCVEFGPGERIKCPAPGRTSGRTCDQDHGQVGYNTRTRVCLTAEASIKSHRLVNCTRCRNWLRFEDRDA